jgi:hypothetical protein
MDFLEGRSKRMSLEAGCAVDALSVSNSTISPSDADGDNEAMVMTLSENRLRLPAFESRRGVSV